ncbi:MAG: hypothetical protein CL694_12070 [Chloroflexi bacterium]|nr:hypothetical protein [Chloroflexota bacterium]MQG57473.1 amidohydrolase family protein [SAR202 cluster bacterium]
MRLLLRNCSIIDANEPAPRENAHVIVEDGAIVEVGTGGASGADETIDLGGSYLLPGLWDVHTHLKSGTWSGMPSYESPAEAVLTNGRNAMDALEAGVTSMRVVGVQGWADVAWREAFASGRFTGPRLFCCGTILSPTAGHGASLVRASSGLTGDLDGPEAFVKAVRTNIKNGVDQTKLLTTGGIMGAGHDVMSAGMMLKQEIEAAARISIQRGLPVAVHATNPESVKWCVDAGAHSIEHGYILDEEAVRLMGERGVYYVPTLALSHLTADQAATEHERAYCERNQLPDAFRERANRFAPRHEESLRMALDAGIKIASGSDQGPPRDAALLEIELLARCGLGAHGAIVAATKHAAEICLAGDRLGTVEPGKLADLIAVRDNPLDDISNLRTLELVLKEGRIVVDRRGDGAK